MFDLMVSMNFACLPRIFKSFYRLQLIQVKTLNSNRSNPRSVLSAILRERDLFLDCFIKRTPPLIMWMHQLLNTLSFLLSNIILILFSSPFKWTNWYILCITTNDITWRWIKGCIIKKKKNCGGGAWFFYWLFIDGCAPGVEIRKCYCDIILCHS